jgi:hypothetical protein
MDKLSFENGMGEAAPWRFKEARSTWQCLKLVNAFHRKLQ